MPRTPPKGSKRSSGLIRTSLSRSERNRAPFGSGRFDAAPTLTLKNGDEPSPRPIAPKNLEGFSQFPSDYERLQECFQPISTRPRAYRLLVHRHTFAMPLVNSTGELRRLWKNGPRDAPPNLDTNRGTTEKTGLSLWHIRPTMKLFQFRHAMQKTARLRFGSCLDPGFSPDSV